MALDQSRDIEGDYKAAYIAEHAAYLRDGRTAEAKNVAAIVRKRWGIELEPKAPTPQLETTAADAPPETAAPDRPKRGRPRKTTAPDSE